MKFGFQSYRIFPSKSVKEATHKNTTKTDSTKTTLIILDGKELVIKQDKSRSHKPLYNASSSNQVAEDFISEGSTFRARRGLLNDREVAILTGYTEPCSRMNHIKIQPHVTKRPLACLQPEDFDGINLTINCNSSYVAKPILFFEERNEKIRTRFIYPLAKESLSKVTPTSYQQCTKIAFHLIKGLSHLHSNYIVHRDIKPDNILMFDNNQWKFCDFGFSEHFQNKPLSEFFVGSPGFIAPELLNTHLSGQQLYTFKDLVKADTWSLGSVLYYLFTYQQSNPHDREIGKMERTILYDHDQNVDYIHHSLKNLNTIGIEDRYQAVLKGFLNPDPQNRMTLKEALALLNPWSRCIGWF